MQQASPLSRRGFLAGGLAAAATMAAPRSRAARVESAPQICSFVKFVQALSYDELAEQIAGMGFDGIEATIRKGGQIEPERAVDELPRLVEALRNHDLDITIMASSINRVDRLTERVLRAAALLGIKRYRLAYYRYERGTSVTQQLEQLRPVARELAALNHDLGLTGVYQNHAGAGFVGSTIWDLRELFRGLAPEDMAIGFDIRHATAEAGLSWPLLFDVAQPHLGAIYVKDFEWHGRHVENVPLGKGRVDPGFVKLALASGFSGPWTLHVEYLEEEGVAENLAAMKNDLATLRSWLAAAQP